MTGADASRHDPLLSLRQWVHADGRAALATVVSTWGSSPVPVGGMLAVRADGHFEGSVSGGCVEAEAIATALDIAQTGVPRLLAFGVSDETAWQAGLPCGGRVEIFIERLTRDDGADLDAILSARAARRMLAVEKHLTSGARRLYTEVQGASAPAARAMRAAESGLAEDEGGARLFIHVHAPSVRLIVVGATHIGQVLSDLARRIGFEVEILDPRRAFATAARLDPYVRHTTWPEEARTLLTPDERTAVVALTHVGAIDDEALSVALRAPCFYVGALGSRRNHAARLERLRQAGFGPAALARIRGPIGLAIGARGPEEIAVSILAEIVRDMRQPG